jgi:transcriptional regulator with XRE-family HTH domain
VAVLIGADKSAVCCYENDTRQPPYTTLISLANIFNVTTDYLLGYRDRLVDVSELTPDDLEVVKKVVDILKEKNRIIRECNIESDNSTVTQ